MTRRPFIRYALALALLASAQAVVAMPARRAAQLRAESCCARNCHHARAVSCAARCCFVAPASADVATLGASSTLPTPVLTSTSACGADVPGVSLAAAVGPGATAAPRAGPLFLRLRSLRL